MKVIVTGEPGVGKTTLVKGVVRRMKDKVIGFWTEEVRDRRGKRKGFRVVTTDGRGALFASKTFTSRYLVGSYGVNIKRFEEVVLPLLERARREADKVLVIDEVGKMELFSGKFAELVRELSRDPRRSFLITIPIRDVHPIVRELRRLPGAVLIHLTRINREGMEEEVVKLLT